MIVDGPAIVTAHLSAESAITDIVGDEIVDQTPRNTDGGWLKVALLQAPQADNVPFDYLVPFVFQFDAYAGEGETQAEASLLGRIVRASLNEMPLTSHTDAVVTSVRHLSFRYLPDTDLEPARDRYILVSTVVAHPA